MDMPRQQLRRSAFLFTLLFLVPASGQAGDVDPSPEKDPIGFLQESLKAYDRLVTTGYTANMRKQERIGGDLKPSEEIELYYREKPYSVLMRWLKGERKAIAVLYVEGENDNMLLARPPGLAGRLVSYVRRDLDSDDAKQSSRYTMRDMGLRKTCQRTLIDWQAADRQGLLKVEYLGTRKIRETGDKVCHVLKRTNAKPEGDGVMEGTFYFDVDTLMQVGTVLRGEGGKFIGEYFYRDIKLNPMFKADQFLPAALAP